MTRHLLITLVAAVLFLVPRASGEVPNRTPEQLLAGAELAAVGIVKDVHTSEHGQSGTCIYTVTVVRTIKGEAKAGDSVLVQTWFQSLLPGAVGCIGHRGMPKLGEVTTVYARRGEGSGRLPGVLDVILPNGMGAAAPLFVTEELLASPTATAADLDAAVAKAAAAGAWREAERGVRRAIEIGNIFERQAELVRALLGQNKCKEAVAAAVTCVEASKATNAETRQIAERLAFRAAFQADDRPTMVRMELLTARATDTINRWLEARHIFACIDVPEAETAKKEADTRLRDLGYDETKIDIFQPMPDKK